MPSNAEIMAKLFNERLGNHIGRPMYVPKPYQHADQRTMVDVALDTPKVQAELRRGASKAKKKKELTSVQIAKKLKEELKRDIEVKTKSSKHKQSLFEKVGGGVGKVFDVLSRPGYAVDEALKNVAGSINSGEPIWSLGDDAITGAAKGVWGTKKTTFGDFMEEAKKSTGENRFLKEILPGGLHKNAVAKGVASLATGGATAPLLWGKEIKQFEDKHPGFARWEKPIVDIAGSIATDPTTYVGPGVLTKLSKAKFAENAFVKTAIATGQALDKPAARTLFKTQTGAAKAIQFQKDVKIAQAAGHSLKKAEKIATKASKTRDLSGVMAQQQLKDGATRVLKKNVVGRVANKQARFADPNSTYGKTFQKVIDHMVRYGEDTVDKQTGHSLAGALRDHAIHGPEAPKAMSLDIATEFRRVRVANVQGQVDRIKRSLAGVGPKLSMRDIKYLRKSDPLMEKYWDEVDSQLAKGLSAAKKGKKGSKAAQKLNVQDIHRQAYETMMQHLDDTEVRPLERELLSEFGQQTHHTPTIRNLQAGGKISTRIGNGAAHLQDLYTGSLPAKAFSYREGFPGFSSMIAQHVRSKGVARFDQNYKEVSDFQKLHKFTRAERVEARKAVQGKYTLTGQAEKAREFMVEQNAKLADDEIQYGSRDANGLLADNYSFAYIKNGGKQKEKAAVNKFVRETVEKTGSMPTNEEIIAHFPDAHLRIEEDGFRALLLRQKKQIRDQARMGFNDDLVTQYHAVSKNMSDTTAKEMGLVKVEDNSVSKELRESLNPGEHFYLPQQIADTRNVFKEMTGMAQGNEVGNALLRSVDAVTKLFKTANTVYYPSYHIRNMLGDMYFGAIDGVKAKDYIEVTSHLRKTGSLKPIKIADENWPMGKLWNKYLETSKASGFMATDLPDQIGSKIRNVPQQLSEGREDYGRFVHFKHAYSEEYAAAKAAYPAKVAQMKSVNPKIAKDAREFLEGKAEIATRYRVNKFKFDYSALTPFEQKYMKRVMPFYTYMRKAAPTMVESMFLNPRIINNTNRILNQFQPEGGFDDLIAPEWMRAIGYAVPPSQMHATEPWVFRKDILPTNLLNDYTQQNESDSLTQSVLGNLASRINPVALAPLEALQGKQMFSGKPVDNIGEAIFTKFRPYNTAMEISNKRRNLKEFLVQQSGVPFTPLKKGSQKQYIEEVKAVNQRISRLGFKVYLSGSYYHLQDKDTGEVLKKGRAMEDVLSFELQQKDPKDKSKSIQKFVGPESRKKYEKDVARLKDTKMSDLQARMRDIQDLIDAG